MTTSDRKRFETAIHNLIALETRIAVVEEQLALCLQFLEYDARREERRRALEQPPTPETPKS